VNILVGWDNPTEAELIRMYMTVEGNGEIEVCDTQSGLLAAATTGHWDVVLLAHTFPDQDGGFATFLALRTAIPDVPVVLGALAEGIVNLPRFLKNGLRSYLIRDARGDFLFLLLAALESAVAAVQAEQASKVAEVLKHELDGVRKLQETIIPRGIRCQPGYNAVARYEPAEVSVAGGKPVVMAGGDYYEVFPADGQTLVALIGDASGHGLKACMSIITMHTLIHMMTNASYTDSGTFVADINRRLCDNAIVQSGGGFITLFYAAIDTTRHEMHWTSAGHPPALLHDRANDRIVPVGGNSDGGLPLGITTEMGYDVMKTTIPPGSRVLIYSDGLTDALPPTAVGGGQLFGVEGICRTLAAHRDRSLEETLEALFHDSKAYTGGEGRHDDTSVVLVERA
jgi:phosphoserine phosphatase RsbU/P